MKLLFALLISGLLWSNLWAAYTTNIGFIGDHITEVNYANAKSAMKIWIKQMSKDININATIEFYNNFDDFFSDYKKGKVESVIMSPYVYLKYQKKFDKDFHRGWVKIRNEYSKDYLMKYLLISRRDIDYTKQREFIALHKQEDLLAKLVLTDFEHQDKKRYTIRTSTSESKAILDIFFKKADLALIHKESWDIAIELNPQLSKKLYIVHKTDKIFVDMISLLANTMPDNIKDLYLNAMTNINTSEQGRQLMAIFKFNGTVEVSTDDFKAMKKYYNRVAKENPKILQEE
ncbi:PhnD/SsuA/transferrin family substrate-binding protein [Sulfurimonas sp.]